MKSIPIVGWVFLGLVVIVLVFYMLSRGIYIDSTMEYLGYEGGAKPNYLRTCNYLFFNGIQYDTQKLVGDDQLRHCSLFRQPLR
jgi:hypothetical protein